MVLRLITFSWIVLLFYINNIACESTTGDQNLQTSGDFKSIEDKQKYLMDGLGSANSKIKIMKKKINAMKYRVTDDLVQIEDMIKVLVARNYEVEETPCNCTLEAGMEVSSSEDESDDDISSSEDDAIDKSQDSSEEEAGEEEYSPENGLIDRARGKSTFPKEHWAHLTSERVVDGDLSTQFHSISKNRPYWYVDLGKIYDIQTIDILPHPDVPSWFQKIRVFVTSHMEFPASLAGGKEVGYYAGPWDGSGRVVFQMNPRVSGRYVIIQGESERHFMALMDVKVFA